LPAGSTRFDWSVDLRLVGAGGEPVDLWRTINSHGLVELPPMRIDEEARALEVTLPLRGASPRTVRISPGKTGHGVVRVAGPRPGNLVQERVVAGARHVLRLDQDLSAFYEAAATDPDLSWVATGAGRMIRSATVFEDVVKTICTTNCAWSATERMVGALVAELGERAIGTGRHTFPTPVAMAEATEDFYKDVVRAGYRGRYLRDLAASVAAGTTDLEQLGASSRDELSDDELASRLLALPGVGPYAAAHIMLMLGRCSRLVLDSWTRPKYARLNGGRPVSDAAIVRRFRRYGPNAGLAFWLHVTRDWVDEPPDVL
jgi:3-methyladenine DNA glycosylase/8-oxoguanine DNA glycosylase